MYSFSSCKSTQFVYFPSVTKWLLGDETQSSNIKTTELIRAAWLTFLVSFQ